MNSINKVIEIDLVDVSLIDAELTAIKEAIVSDDLGGESLSWRYNSKIFKISANLLDDKFNQVEAILASDEQAGLTAREAALDDVNNTDKKAKKHREIKAIESCAANVADANTKQTLECILNYLKLLE
jgi:hypothetical protein